MADEADLVWIAAQVSGRDAAEVASSADIAALARIVADSESGDGPLERASLLLVGITQRRPFGDGIDPAAAWLAVVLELERVGVRLAADAAAVAALVDGVERGRIDAAAAADMLDACSVYGRRRGSWRCPVCGRELYVRERMRRAPILVSRDRYELTARCAYEHRTHDRRGRDVEPTRDDGVLGPPMGGPSGSPAPPHRVHAVAAGA